MKRNFKEQVRKDILQCLGDYLKKIKQPYQTIKLEYINFSGTSDTQDSGSYFVEVKTPFGILHFFAKKNTALPYRRFLLFYNPIKKIFRLPFSKTSVEQPKDHSWPNVIKARAFGVAIPEYLHLDQPKRIVVEEKIEGLDIQKAFLKNPQETLKLTDQAGKNLAKLHAGGFKFGDLKPLHFIYNFKNNKVNFVDCEKLSEAKDLKDYLKDFYVLACYLPITIPVQYIIPFWEKFMAGYQSIGGEIIKKVLSQVPQLKLPSQFSIFFLKIFYRLNRLTWRISHGHFRLF